MVVVGHKKCGGAAAAFDAPKPAPDAPEPTEPLDVFLEPLIELRHTLPADATVDDLIVANVQSNVINVVNSDVSRGLASAEMFGAVEWARASSPVLSAGR